MTRSAPRYSPPADRARKAARDPFLVRLGVLLLAGVIVTPIAAMIARSDGGEVVQAGNLPGAAVALEPGAESTTIAPAPLPLPSAGTIPATVPPEGTLPATIAPPTTAPATTEADEAASQAVAPAGDSGGAPAAAPASTEAPAPPPTAAPTTAAPPPPPPPQTSWSEGQIIQLIRDVFPDDIEEKAIAIAQRESRFDPNARNFCCTGLFQIYGDVHEKLINSLGFRVDQLTDPLVNCVVALTLYQRSGWAPWGG